MVTDKKARRLLRLHIVISIGIIISIPLLAFPKWDFIMFGLLISFLISVVMNMVYPHRKNLRVVVPLLLLMIGCLSIPLIALAKITLGG